MYRDDIDEMRAPELLFGYVYGDDLLDEEGKHIESLPDTFFVPPYIRNGSYVGLRLAAAGYPQISNIEGVEPYLFSYGTEWKDVRKEPENVPLMVFGKALPIFRGTCIGIFGPLNHLLVDNVLRQIKGSLIFAIPRRDSSVFRADVPSMHVLSDTVPIDFICERAARRAELGENVVIATYQGTADDVRPYCACAFSGGSVTAIVLDGPREGCDTCIVTDATLRGHYPPIDFLSSSTRLPYGPHAERYTSFHSAIGFLTPLEAWGRWNELLKQKD